MRAAVLLLVFVATAAGALEGPSTAPTIAKLAFSEETLGNGLRVVYAPRRGWPVVHARVVYHVGSKDEPADRRGLAHLVEHLMFRGSQHLTSDERSRIVTRAGGITNGETNFDATTYYETMPANELELALWLESERMASFDVSERVLAAERKVVEEEWARRHGNPFESLFEDALPRTSGVGPYRWSPIGDMEELRATTPAQVREFVTQWYGPNNAVLVVAGDFDVASAKAMVRRLFGWIAPRETPAHATSQRAAATQPGIVQVTGAVPWPCEVIVLPMPQYGAVDEPGTRVLGMLLSSGWHHFLAGGERPLASYLDVQHLSLDEGGFLAISAALPRGQTFDQLSDAVFALPRVIYNDIIQRGVSLAAGAAALMAEMRREEASGVASDLAISAVLRGSPGFEDQQLAAMREVRVDQLGKLALKYGDPARALTLRVMPGGGPPMPADLTEVTDTGAEPTTAPETRRAAFFPNDYPAQPPAAVKKADSIAAPRFESTIDHVRVVVLPDAQTSVVHWAMVLHDRVTEPAGKEGVAMLTAAMLAAEQRDNLFGPHARPRELELWGSDLRAWSHGDRTVVLGASLPDHLDDALELTRRNLFAPDFLKPDFEQEALFGSRIRAGLLRMATLLQLERMDANTLAWREIEAAVLKSPPRRPTTRSVLSLKVDDVRSFYRQAYGNVRLLVVAGNVTPERGNEIARSLLQAQALATQPATTEPLDSGSTREPKGMEIVLIDCPGAVQCPLRIVAPAFEATSPDGPAGAIAAHILADGLHSRMGRYVRCDRGYAYSTTAQFFTWNNGGNFLASADTEPQNVPATLTSVLRILDDMGTNDVSETELTEAKAALVARKVVRDESAARRLMTEVNRELAGARDDDDAPAHNDYDAAVDQVRAADVRAVMSKYVAHDRRTVIVAGPASRLKPALQRIAPVRVIEPANEDNH